MLRTFLGVTIRRLGNIDGYFAHCRSDQILLDAGPCDSSGCRMEKIRAFLFFFLTILCGEKKQREAEKPSQLLNPDPRWLEKPARLRTPSACYPGGGGSEAAAAAWVLTWEPERERERDL